VTGEDKDVVLDGISHQQGPAGAGSACASSGLQENWIHGTAGVCVCVCVC